MHHRLAATAADARANVTKPPGYSCLQLTVPLPAGATAGQQLSVICGAVSSVRPLLVDCHWYRHLHILPRMPGNPISQGQFEHPFSTLSSNTLLVLRSHVLQNLDIDCVDSNAPALGGER
jgi:hypothetical protein